MLHRELGSVRIGAGCFSASGKRLFITDDKKNLRVIDAETYETIRFHKLPFTPEWMDYLSESYLIALSDRECSPDLTCPLPQADGGG